MQAVNLIAAKTYLMKCQSWPSGRPGRPRGGGGSTCHIGIQEMGAYIYILPLIHVHSIPDF
jgi:hypothetical protein